MPGDQFVLGIDGGGTKTVAWLARRFPPAEQSALGRGSAGASNPQAVGFAKAIENLNRAIAAAFADARVKSGPVAAAVLALAGSDRPENRRVLTRWAEDHRLADRFCVVSDALPVLIAGSPDGWGVALIAGTGSFAFGQSRHGRSSRAGGWGFLFGDEGSSYAVALAGLRAAAKSADGRAPATGLLDALLDRLGLQEPQDLVTSVYRIAADRAAVASLGGVVTSTAAQGDPTAQRILDEAASELAAMVAAVARKLDLAGGPFPLAVAGGLLLGSRNLQDGLEAQIASMGLRPDPIAGVIDPVLGAVKLAQAEADNRRTSG